MESLSELLKQFKVVSPAENGGDTSSSVARTDHGGVPPSVTLNGGQEPSVCPDCDGIGWVRHEVPVEHQDFGRLFPCRCRLAQFDAERQGRLARFSNLGHLIGVTFQSLQPPTTGGIAEQAWRGGLQVARAYATQATKGWLVISGAPGSGKTRIAAAVANACIARGQAVLFLPVADLLDHLRATYAPNTEVSYDTLFEQVRNVPVLILDDLGQESATPWAQEKLAQVLNHRYNAAMPTVITTDLPVERLDERLRARVMDASLCRLIRLSNTRTGADDGLASFDLHLPRMTFDTFKADGGGLAGAIRSNLADAYNLAKSWAGQPDGWLVLIGGHGTGKTHLASAIANRCRERGDDVLFILAPQLLDYLRSTIGQRDSHSYAAFQRVERVGVLVLDDLTESSSTAWAEDRLDLLLNYRYLNRLPTVITSSLPPEKMEPRIWSRLSDVRLSNVYVIEAPDYRTGQPYPRPAEGTTEERPRSKPRGRGLR